MLDREEYVEQAYFFRAIGDRMKQQLSAQDLLATVREELLSTTKLPLAIDFMLGELRLNGVFGTAMARLGHYFTPFQTYVITEAENERGRFEFGVALEVLHREAAYRAEGASRQGVFLYQFEALCRNRLGYDRGLKAIAGDTVFDAEWREWLDELRRRIGFADFADLLYIRSEHYAQHRAKGAASPPEPEKPILFGEKEGRIALANRRKDPLLLFAALQRHLGYPAVPRPKPVDDLQTLLPNLLRRVDRLETRLKLLEEEQKGGIDLRKFYQKPPDARGGAEEE